jgi:copper chaperone CopZ
MATLDLQIEKMHCGACVRRVTQVLNGLPQTHANSVQIGAARVTTDASSEEITRAMEAAGFPARVTTTQP